MNFYTPDHWSAMAEAARNSDESLLPLLVSKGGDINAMDNAHRPITMDAYMAGRLANMRYLLHQGAKIDAKDSVDKTLLMTMANQNDYDQMLQLLEQGADPKITSGQNHISTAWIMQEQAGRLTPVAEQQRQQVVKALEARGVTFPVPRPATYHWDPEQKKFVLPTPK